MTQRFLVPISVGFFLAVLTVFFSLVLSDTQALEFHAVLLTLIASIYIGFALQGGSRREVRLELSVAATFVIFALFGLWLSPCFIVLGLALHGVWDFLHHDLIHTPVPRWYIPLCMVYDGLIAGFLSLYLVL